MTRMLVSFHFALTVAGHTITKATKTGERLMMLCPHGVVRKTAAEIDEAVGVVQQPAVLQSGKPFNKPTDVCVRSTATAARPTTAARVGRQAWAAVNSNCCTSVCCCCCHHSGCAGAARWTRRLATSSSRTGVSAVAGELVLAALAEFEPVLQPRWCRAATPHPGVLTLVRTDGNSRIHHLKADGTPIKSWGVSPTAAFYKSVGPLTSHWLAQPL